jgi:hypothetical protein
MVALHAGANVGYNLTATATDANGDTSEFGANRVVTSGSPVPTPTTYAQDSFSRQVTDGWGSANIGGPYTLAGTAANFDVNGSSGTVASAANATRSAYLSNVLARDIDISVRVRADKSATSGAQIIYLVARRGTGGTEYLGRLRFASDSSVRLQAARTVAGTTTLLGNEKVVAGLTQTANATFRLRLQVVGTNPTTLRLKVWADGQAEPATWAYSITDSTAELQAGGAVGVRTYLSSTAINVPVLFTFDDLLVTSGSP